MNWLDVIGFAFAALIVVAILALCAEGADTDEGSLP